MVARVSAYLVRWSEDHEATIDSDREGIPDTEEAVVGWVEQRLSGVRSPQIESIERL